MARPLSVLGAASNIGAAPYEDGEPRHVNRAPRVLRDRGIVERLNAIDLGDVTSPPYRDIARPPLGVRNETEVLVYSRLLADRVAVATAHGRFGLVIGGDCSVVLGCLLGARQTAGGTVGLVYVDAHADFATPEESRTGSVASMALALATGRGDGPLIRLAGRKRLVRDEHIALLGRRDGREPWRGHAALSRSAILDLPLDTDGENHTSERNLADLALARGAAAEVQGFWIQVDVDVLNPMAMPAVDSAELGGPMPNELAALLAPLVRHPRAIGLSLTVYDPALDPDRSAARQLVRMVESIFTASVSTDAHHVTANAR